MGRKKRKVNTSKQKHTHSLPYKGCITFASSSRKGALCQREVEGKPYKSINEMKFSPFPAPEWSRKPPNTLYGAAFI